MADEDFVDVGRGDSGIVERADGDLRDQGLDVPVFVLAELRVGPAHDACGHADIPVFEGARLAGRSRDCYDRFTAGNNQAGRGRWRIGPSRRC